MIQQVSAPSDPFPDFVRHLLELHRLIADGQGDSDESDEVRDRMDYPWRCLNPEQLALVSGLSEDLYTIDVDRPTPTTEPAADLWKQFTDAVEGYDWRTALDALRACAPHLPPARVAYLRAACWVYLEQFDAAIEFLYERERLQPLEPDEEVLFLNCLMANNRLAEAEARADEVREEETHSPLLLAAGTALSRRATELESAAARPLRTRAVDLLERGLHGAATGSANGVSTPDRVGAYLHLAANYEALGNSPQAIGACVEALQLDPNNLDALQLHGWLIRESEPETGQQEFRKGFLNRLPSEAFSPLPSSFVAHDA